MADWNIMHIFSFGQSQLMGKGLNKSVKLSSLTPSVLDAFVNEIWSHKPSENNSSENYHAINCFHTQFIDWLPKTGKPFRVKWSDLNLQIIEALVDEILNYAPPTNP